VEEEEVGVGEAGVVVALAGGIVVEGVEIVIEEVGEAEEVEIVADGMEEEVEEVALMEAEGDSNEKENKYCVYCIIIL